MSCRNYFREDLSGYNPLCSGKLNKAAGPISKYDNGSGKRGWETQGEVLIPQIRLIITEYDS